MGKRKVISRTNLPSNLPLGFTMLTYMMMDYYAAPGWMWGSWAVVMLFVWGLIIFGLINEQSQDLFK